jgi:hypothetical protein
MEALDNITQAERELIAALRAAATTNPAEFVIQFVGSACRIRLADPDVSLPVLGGGATFQEAWASRKPTSLASNVTDEERACWAAQYRARNPAPPEQPTTIEIVSDGSGHVKRIYPDGRHEARAMTRAEIENARLQQGAA